MAGVVVQDRDVEWVIDALTLKRTLACEDALGVVRSAAATGLEIVALTPDQRLAILSVLDDPPKSLAELRGALASDLTHGG
jgi:hypothetical protein